MKPQQIEWLSKQGLLESLRTQLYQLKLRHLCNDTKGRIHQLELIIEEVERT